MKTCSTLSNNPRSTMRRPSSRKARRISCTTLMLFVLVRSRPTLVRWATRSPASNAPRASASPASMPRTWAVPASRSVARTSVRAWGESASAAKRMRSMAASGRPGLVPHTWLRSSHSFGPRHPKSRRKCPKRQSNSAASLSPASASALSRSARPGRPASNAAVNASDPRTMRPSSHSAKLGAAESTSPSPDTSVITSSGRPTAAATWATAPRPMPDALDTVMWRQKSRR